MKHEKGFALLASLILLLIITMIGFRAANQGIMSSQLSKTSVRYEEIFSVAEAEMYNLINTLQRTTKEIPATDTITVNSQNQFTEVWGNQALASEFGSVGLANFQDFNNTSWGNGVLNNYPTSYGTVNTQSFVQELVERQVTASGKPLEVEKQYLVTVKAYAQNPGDPATQERETVVLQSVYGLRFLR